jgi:cyanophycinase
VFEEILVSAPRAESAGPRDPVRVLLCTLASQCSDAAARALAAFETAPTAKKPGNVAFESLDFLPLNAGRVAESERETLFATKTSLLAHMHRLALAGHGLTELARAEVLWFTGGDQRLILETLRDTPFESEMMARWRAGTLLVAGTSAGLQVCSSIALTGDFHVAPTQPGLGDSPGEADDTPLRTLGPVATGTPSSPSLTAPGRGLVVTTRGFAFLEGVVLDQHFIRRQRHNRLFSACLDHPGSVGIGVDEGTALVVTRDPEQPSRGVAHVVGNSCVFYVDTRGAKLESSAALPERTGDRVSDLSCGFAWEGARLPFELSLPS